MYKTERQRAVVKESHKYSFVFYFFFVCAVNNAKKCIIRLQSAKNLSFHRFYDNKTLGICLSRKVSFIRFASLSTEMPLERITL
jgi:hypothetical protein